MTSRSIHLGLVVPRGPGAEELREALWRGHREGNEAAKEIEDALLLMRGESYLQAIAGRPDEDPVEVCRADVNKACLAHARRMQRLNGGKGGSKKLILSLLKRLYGYVVPSFVLDEDGKPGKGSASEASAFQRPLMLRGSEGGLACIEQAVTPVWLEKFLAWKAKNPKDAKEVENVPRKILDEATAWTGSSQCLETFVPLKGRSPAWHAAVKARGPATEWLLSFASWHKRKRDEASGSAAVIQQLKSLGVLPFLDGGPVSRKLYGETGRFSARDAAAFKSAVSQLMSWESNNHRVKAEYAAGEAEVRAAREELGNGKHVRVLKAYESRRRAELSEQFGEPRNFWVTLRQVKGWRKVRERWLEALDGPGRASQKDLEAIAKQAQKESGSKFGDAHLYAYLAAPAARSAWKDEDHVFKFALWRSAGARLKYKKLQASYCGPDPRLHPRWCEFEPGGGRSTNLRHYRFDSSAGKRHLALVLPLLFEEEGKLVERDQVFKVAASRQFIGPAFKQLEEVKGGKKKPAGVEVDYMQGSGNVFRALLASSTLQFDRKGIEGKSLEALDAGGFGSVRFALSLDVAQQCPEGWAYESGPLKGKPRVPLEAYHFLSSLGETFKRKVKTKVKKKGKVRTVMREVPFVLEPGLRFMAVNLNVNRFAALSVYELVRSKRRPRSAGPAFEVGDDLWFACERVRKLVLPGERPSLKQRAARKHSMDMLQDLRGRINFAKEVFRALEKDGKAGQRELTSLAESDDYGLFAGLVKDSKLVRGAASKVAKRFRAHKADLEQVVTNWRKEHAKRLREHEVSGTTKHEFHPYGSLEGVEYLEECIALYKSWATKFRKKGSDGVFLSSLRRHIRNMKQQRIKLGANLIVQAALGKVKGIRRYAPCQLIVFEDKNRYDFRYDRPRAENRQLMRWCHRAIEETVAMQGELYGISVKTVNAGYIGRYDATTGAPGVRCYRFREDDVLSKKGAEELGELGYQEVFQGDLVPFESGNLFASVTEEGLRVVDAEINQSWNIARRFCTRHADVFRVKAAEVDGRLLSCGMGKRLAGAVKAAFGKPCLELEGVGRKAFVATPCEDEELKGRRSKSFFRDPSGVLFPPEFWAEREVFWRKVLEATARGILSEVESTASA
jgi:hypothetical protein